MCCVRGLLLVSGRRIVLGVCWSGPTKGSKESQSIIEGAQGISVTDSPGHSMDWFFSGNNVQDFPDMSSICHGKIPIAFLPVFTSNEIEHDSEHVFGHRESLTWRVIWSGHGLTIFSRLLGGCSGTRRIQGHCKRENSTKCWASSGAGLGLMHWWQLLFLWYLI